jgi:hypothetical protein
MPIALHDLENIIAQRVILRQNLRMREETWLDEDESKRVYDESGDPLVIYKTADEWILRVASSGQETPIPRFDDDALHPVNVRALTELISWGMSLNVCLNPAATKDPLLYGTPQIRITEELGSDDPDDLPRQQCVLMDVPWYWSKRQLYWAISQAERRRGQVFVVCDVVVPNPAGVGTTWVDEGFSLRVF